MKKLFFVQNQSMKRVICQLWLTILMCGAIVVIFPSTEAVTKTKKECKRELEVLIKKRGLKPSKEAYYKARDYCERGDMRSAAEILASSSESKKNGKMSVEECKRELEVLKRRLNPSREAYSRALRYCERGDIRSAAEILKSSSESKKNGKMIKKECESELQALIRGRGLNPSREAYSRALRYCEGGDMRSAAEILASSSDSKKSGKMTRKECEKGLGFVIARKGINPSEEAYSKALRYCEGGDMKTAIDVLTR